MIWMIPAAQPQQASSARLAFRARKRSRRLRLGNAGLVLMAMLVPGAVWGQTATGTSVTLSSTSVARGAAVTLTATVMAAGFNVGVGGAVAFCDDTASFCTDIHRVGTGQLTAAGSASLKLMPGIGSHRYRAEFLGKTGYAASRSGSSAELTVTGSLPTSTMLTASGSAGSYSVQATVTGTGVAASLSGAIRIPTGAASLLDLSNRGYVLGSSALLAGPSSFALAGGSSTLVGNSPDGAATADFNGDGIPDLVTVNGAAGTFSILLGKGDGTFAATPFSCGLSPSAVTAGDFNDDGIIDLAIAGQVSGSGAVAVFLGNGYGSFTPLTLTAGSAGVSAIVAGDFNGDGEVDLAEASSTGDSFAILLGTGSGAFGPFHSVSTGTSPVAMVVGDFNRDGIADLAMAVSDPLATGTGQVAVLLGLGDGSFTTSYAALPTGYNPASLATADLNQDGFADLVAGDPQDGTLVLLLGDGSGHYGMDRTLATSANTSTALAVGDFDADGNPDIAVSSGGITEILLGQGDGSFRVGAVAASGGLTASLLVADFNGDGLPDLGGSNGSNAAVVTLSQVTGTASTLLENVSLVGVSTHMVVESYQGDAVFGASVSNSTGLTAEPVATTLTLSAAPAQSNFGRQVVLTATLTPDGAQGNGVDGDLVFFKNEGVAIGAAPLAGGVATLNLTTLPIGVDPLTASFLGVIPFNASDSNTVFYTVTALTATSLAITAGGSSVSTVAAGTVVTLTASVVTAGAPITPGVVQFCDAAAASCTATHLYGMAQLTSAGAAAIRFVPGPGSHSYKAVFVGTSGDAASASAASTLVVTPVVPASVVLTATGPADDYTLTAAVTGTASPQPPTGALSFVDSTAGSAVAGSALLGAGTSAFSLLPGATGAPGSNPQEVVAGDFNGDGVPDLAAANQATSTVTILRGNGDGTFRASIVSLPPSTILGVSTIATGDFNGDGIADLVVSGAASAVQSAVVILLGRGDGTFAQAAETAVGREVFSLVVGDFNQDGNADVVVASYDSGTTLLLGDGTGNLSGTENLAAGSYPLSLAAGDFNGDGKLDLAVVSNPYATSGGLGLNGTLEILLGTGAGGFNAASVPLPTGANPYAVATADFNGDGTADLVITDLSSGAVTVLLGDGAGNFPTASSPATGVGASSVTSGDFNGDGVADLAFFSGGGVQVLLGAGDGTFPVTVNAPGGNLLSPPAVADFNGDGLADLAVTDVSGAGVLVQLAQNTTLATASVSGISPTGTANHLVLASYAGDTLHAGASSVTVSLATPPYVAQPGFSPAPGGYSAAQSVVIADATPGAQIFYTTDGSVPTTASLPYSGPIAVGTTTTIQAIATLAHDQPSPVAGGTFTISVQTAAEPTFFPAPGVYSVAQSVVIADATPGAQIFYTTDGSVPTTASLPYSGPIAVNTTTTIRAIATAADDQPSPVVSGTFTISMQTAATPVFSPGSGEYAGPQTVTITDATPGAALYYSTDGSVPTSASPRYGGPLAIATTTTIHAFATASGYNQSPVATAVLSIDTAPSCTLRVQGTSVALVVAASIACTDPQGQALTTTLNWGDGTVTPAASNTHRYAKAGTYTVVLTATDASGLITTAQQQVMPNQLPLCSLALLGVASAAGASNAAMINATPACSDPQGQALSLSIDWGDGTTTQTATNNGGNGHTYTVSGSSTATTYAVAVTATDGLGLASTTTQPVMILAPAVPVQPGGASSVAASLPASTTATPIQVTFLCSSVSTIGSTGQTVVNALPSAYGISCSAPTLTLSSVPTPVQVTIQTTSATATTTARREPGTSRGLLLATMFPVSVLGGFLVGVFLPGPRRRRNRILLAGMLMGGSVALTSCSSGGAFTPPPVTATPAGQYLITITEVVVTTPPPTNFVQTSLIVQLPVGMGGK